MDKSVETEGRERGMDGNKFQVKNKAFFFQLQYSYTFYTFSTELFTFTVRKT